MMRRSSVSHLSGRPQLSQSAWPPRVTRSRGSEGSASRRIIRGPGSRPALSSGRWDGGARSLRRQGPACRPARGAQPGMLSAHCWSCPGARRAGLASSRAGTCAPATSGPTTTGCGRGCRAGRGSRSPGPRRRDPRHHRQHAGVPGPGCDPGPGVPPQRPGRGDSPAGPQDPGPLPPDRQGNRRCSLAVRTRASEPSARPPRP